jgi:hypothetical protein
LIQAQYLTVGSFVVGVVLMTVWNHYAEASGQDNPTTAEGAAVAAKELHRVHTMEQFSFLAHGLLADVFPLFGAERESRWAPGWEPSFIWPTDQAGMVFQVAHEKKRGSARLG